LRSVKIQATAPAASPTTTRATIFHPSIERSTITVSYYDERGRPNCKMASLRADKITKSGARPIARFAGTAAWLRKNFYFTMAVVIAAVVVYGFSQTFAVNLEHPPYPRPWILYVHATVFPLWILLFLTQTALVRRGSTGVHRSLGPFGLALGALLPIVAITTAIVMDRLHAVHGEEPYFYPAFFIVHINDEVAFVALVGLAALLRTKREFHSRLMFLGAAILTDAPFSRFPAFQARPFAITLGIAYACVDLLILCGVTRDWLLEKRINAVYRFALPALVGGQAITTAIFATAPSWWLAISHRIIGA
jgi:hypothetical protein